MKIIVCVKQVPDISQSKVDPETYTIIRTGVDAVVNPFDLYAVEAALRIKDELGSGVTITAISMGPPQAENALREVISMGVDNAVLLSSKDFAGSDTLATSYALAKGIIQTGQTDLVITGRQAIDGDTAQVGPGIAEHLGYPVVTDVNGFIEIAENQLKLRVMTEEGYVDLSVGYPAVISVGKGIGEPRMPSLRNKTRSRKEIIPVWSPDEIDADTGMLGLKGSPTQVVKIFTPEVGGQVLFLDGEPPSQAGRIVEILTERHLI
ncbi:electron transfer flavoprotein subunit beta/FixA family protein [candidate division WOR-3 bacterium]|nr:electron transfer flavoprotein subunit beta/FixA family protein [candidate division WOR-3 bacterium]